jgi:hypothetical protein
MIKHYGDTADIEAAGLDRQPVWMRIAKAMDELQTPSGDEAMH